MMQMTKDQDCIDLLNKKISVQELESKALRSILGNKHEKIKKLDKHIA